MNFTLPELAAIIEGTAFEWHADGSVGRAAADERERPFSFSIDSRTLRDGQVFIAFRGPNADGHDYLDQALRKGACGLIVRDLERVTALRPDAMPNVSAAAPFVIQVPDPLHALQVIARACRARHPLPLAGITGSNGKTTVKDMTASILATRYRVLKSYKSFNNLIGLPLTLANMTPEHEMAVVEMGMNAPGEILQLAQIAAPDVGAITNIAPAHFGFFESLDAILRAKLELFEMLPPEGMTVINADDERFEQMLHSAQGRRVIAFGMYPSLDRTLPYVFPTNIAMSADAMYTFTLNTPNGAIGVNLAVPGYHTILNAVAATAVALALGPLDLEAIKAGLETFQPGPMRMQISTHHQILFINDAYNANPVSMAAALHTLQRFPCQGRKIAVLGDMFELGPISAEAHYTVGQQAADVPVDHLLLLGEYAEDVARGARDGGMAQNAVFIGDSHTQLAEELAAYARPHDILLVKASRGMMMEKVLELYLLNHK